MLNVPRLRILYELTRRGSVSAVAEALWITPSAVSQHLAALEREVGTRLVERVGRGVRPTEAGRRLARDAERVLAALDVADATVHGLTAGGPAMLRVAAFPSVVLGVLSPALDRLRGTDPDLAVEVIDVEGAAGVDEVRLGRADLAVVDDWGWDLGARHPGLTVTPLMADPLLALLPAGHPLAAADGVRWSDLAGADWVMEPRATLFTQQIAAHCRRAGFEPRVRARVSDFATQAALVRALGLVTVLPRSALGAALGVVARPLVPELRRRLMLVARDGVAGAATDRLVAALRAVAAGPVAAIRAYRPEDEASWLRCRALAFLGSAYFDDVRTAKPELGDGVELVAVDSGEVVGVLDVAIAGATATIDTVAVRPEHLRGGLATALLDQALEALQARGVRTLDAWTRDDAAANAWYAARGFAVRERYLQLYATDPEQARSALSPEPGIVPVQAFLHCRDLGREAELRARFGRVHVCRCYARAV